MGFAITWKAARAAGIGHPAGGVDEVIKLLTIETFSGSSGPAQQPGGCRFIRRANSEYSIAYYFVYILRLLFYYFGTNGIPGLHHKNQQTTTEIMP